MRYFAILLAICFSASQARGSSDYVKYEDIAWSDAGARGFVWIVTTLRSNFVKIDLRFESVSNCRPNAVSLEVKSPEGKVQLFAPLEIRQNSVFLLGDPVYLNRASVSVECAPSEDGNKQVFRLEIDVRAEA